MQGFKRWWSGNAVSKFQYYLDKSTPHPVARWVASVVAALLLWLRIYYVEGFYWVMYFLGVYIVHLLILFLSPQVDPEISGPALPTRASDEFKPFVRRLPEFKFWYAVTRAFLVAFSLTFFNILDVPALWPVLLMSWILLFVFHITRQIWHMIKYRYIPLSFGKQRYSGRQPADQNDPVSTSRDFKSFKVRRHISTSSSDLV